MEVSQVIGSPIVEQLQRFSGWRTNLAAGIRGLEALTSEFGLLPGGVMLRLETMAHEIGTEEVRVAFVGEFSRGKTELINALFFSGFGGRFLPSSSGQTTMCPVEIRNAPLGSPGLQLLPIASRAMDVTIQSLKRATSAWHRLPLNPQDVKARTETLAHLTENICVPIEEARRLGLCPPLNQTRRDRQGTVCPSCGLGKVFIPRWRHAMIYLPHPVLDSGLTILDTPGLNAIGAEPELTLGLLAEADAVVFILGADTGVTHSDMEIWDQYLTRNPRQKQLVVLNKIDTLWDELKSPGDVAAEIDRQVEKTAGRLGVEVAQVIPLSAQKALLARVRGNREILEKSGIARLEEAIAGILIPAKREEIRRRSQAVVARVVTDQQALLNSQIQELEEQADGLASLKDQTREKLPRLLAQHQKTMAQFEQDRHAFEAQKQEFLQAAEEWLLEPLSPLAFDLIISNAKSEMLSAWTTAGIVDRFEKFFEEAISHFDSGLDGARKLAELISSRYRKLEELYRVPHLNAVPYAIMPRRTELMEMAENYERFGKKLEIAVNTQSAVVRKAFLTAATKVRDFVVETRQEAEAWVDELMAVMNRQLEIHQAKSQEQMEALRSISQTLGNIDIRTAQLRRQQEERKASQRRLKEVYLPIAHLLEAHPTPGSGQ